MILYMISNIMLTIIQLCISIFLIIFIFLLGVFVDHVDDYCATQWNGCHCVYNGQSTTIEGILLYSCCCFFFFYSELLMLLFPFFIKGMLVLFWEFLQLATEYIFQWLLSTWHIVFYFLFFLLEIRYIKWSRLI